MATIKLANGIVIEGVTQAYVDTIVNGVEDGIHYKSATHGKIAIKDMATPHLKNAVLKNARTEIESLKNATAAQVASSLRAGVGMKSVTTLSMVKELGTRRDY